MSTVRGACPTLAEPMLSGDGLLARLMPIGPITLDALAGLCAAAAAHGNGMIEVSARGSLQIRGLAPQSAPLFTAAMAALDIELCGSVPVIAAPFPGDPGALIDAGALARTLVDRLEAARLGLAPKVSVIVDGGGRLHLDALAADIRLRAVTTEQGPKINVGIAGDAATAQPLGVLAADAAVTVTLRLLQAIAAMGATARASDLPVEEAIDVFRSVSGAEPTPAPLPPRPRAEPIGRHALREDSFAVGFGFAFGHTQARTLTALTEAAKAIGAGWTQPAPGRALLLWPLDKASCEALEKAAERLGFVIDARDPRRRVVACPGAPACASGLIPARRIAAELAAQLPLTDDAVALHVSGCAKGCAHSATAALTVVGTERGCGLVCDGTARSAPLAYADAANLVAEIARLSRTREVAHA